MQAQLDRLRQRYDFPSWSAPRGPSSLTWGFQLAGNELPGWRPHRIQIVDLPGEPPASLSVWRPTQGTGALLAVNVYECDDETAARSYLLRLLGEFQGPALQRVTEPGDIAFAAGSTGIMFARANLVALVRSIERTPAPVADAAQRLDRVLDLETEPVDGDAPDITSLSVPESPIEAGRAIPISAAASDPAGGTVWFRFRCDTGRLQLQNRRPVFIPASAGPHSIEVSAIGASGITFRALRVGPPAGTDEP